MLKLSVTLPPKLSAHLVFNKFLLLSLETKSQYIRNFWSIPVVFSQGSSSTVQGFCQKLHNF